MASTRCVAVAPSLATFSGNPSLLGAEKFSKGYLCSKKIYCPQCFPPKPAKGVRFWMQRRSRLRVFEDQTEQFPLAFQEERLVPEPESKEASPLCTKSQADAYHLHMQHSRVEPPIDVFRGSLINVKTFDSKQHTFEVALLHQTKLAEEWRRSRDIYIVLTTRLDRVRYILMNREKEVTNTQLVLSYKAQMLQSLLKELKRKDDQLQEYARNFENKCGVLKEAKEVINRQSCDLKNLEIRVVLEEKDLLSWENRRKKDLQKLQEIEVKLETRWAMWHLFQLEMKKLVIEVAVSGNRYSAAEGELSSADIRLADLKKRLQRSQKSAEALRGDIRAKEGKIRDQMGRIRQQKRCIKAYQQKLKEAELQLEAERKNLLIAEEKYKKLEREMLKERQIANQINETLQKYKVSLLQKTHEMNSLKLELERTCSALDAARVSLQMKESELLSTRTEIQRINSEMASMQADLDSKGNSLRASLLYTDDLHEEILQLRCLIKSKDEEIQKTKLLFQGNEKKINEMALDLADSKLKICQAASAMASIAQLTEALLDSDKASKLGIDGEPLFIEANSDLHAAKLALREKNMELQRLEEMSIKKYKQQQIEIESLKNLLNEMEKESLGAKRDLALKEQELTNLKNRWEEREKTLINMRNEILEEANGLRILHANAQSRIGNKTLGEYALENLELENARLEAEAGGRALKHLVELSNELLHSKVDDRYFQETQTLKQRDLAFRKTEKAILHLSKFTKQLLATACTTAV